jgi:hypothetical protein
MCGYGVEAGTEFFPGHQAREQIWCARGDGRMAGMLMTSNS